MILICFFNGGRRRCLGLVGGDRSDVDDRVSYSSGHSGYSAALGDNDSDIRDPENHSRRLGDLHRHFDGGVWDGVNRVKTNIKVTSE